MRQVVMDRKIVMVRPNATQDNGNRSTGQPGEGAPGDERVREERKRYTTQLQRRAQAHVTAELGVDTGAADVDRQIAMLLQHAMETTGARRITLFRPVPKGQRWHAATVLDDGGFYYGLIAPDSLVLPMSAFHQKRALILSADRPHEPSVPRPSDLGFKSYLGVPVISGGEVVAVIEAVDVAHVEELERYADSLEQAVDALAEALAAESRRYGWRPAGGPSHPLAETAILDIVLRPPVEADDTFEVSPQEWLILNQLNGERSLGDAATAAGIQVAIASTVAASLLERGLIRIGRENRRRL
jgi:GAF domain-containing protein